MSGGRVLTLQDDLREELVPWILLPCAVVGLVLVVSDSTSAPPPSRTAFGLALLLFVTLIWVLRRGRYPAIAWAMSVIWLGLVVLGWVWFPDVRAYQAVLLPIIGASLMLGPRAGIVMAGIKG